MGLFDSLTKKNNQMSQKEKIEKNEISKKQNVNESIVENNDDWANNGFIDFDGFGFGWNNNRRLNRSADSVFGGFCFRCEKNGIAHFPSKFICDICGTVFPMGPLTCGRYFSPNQNNGSNYENSLLSKCILDNKKENSDASDLLSKFMFDFIKNHPKFFNPIISTFDLIIPVPNFKSDLQNVAAVSISLKLSKLLNIPCNTNILIKTQSTVGRKDHKSKLERMTMAYSSFDICPDPPIENKCILLIDDVLVGGSTTRKCAELLMENGANVSLIMCAGEYSVYG